MEDLMIDRMNADREAEAAAKYQQLNVKLTVDAKPIIKDLEAQKKILYAAFGVPRKYIRWSCSDHCHHEHRYRWTAAICGWIQRVFRFFR
jgi:hypothetical protein